MNDTIEYIKKYSSNKEGLKEYIELWCISGIYTIEDKNKIKYIETLISEAIEKKENVNDYVSLHLFK